MTTTDRYNSPLTTRYASEEMAYNFSDAKKFTTWRRLWIILAKAEKQLGLGDITEEMIAEMEANVVSSLVIISDPIYVFGLKLE
jgi:adenylosuccinate lyase